MSVNLVTLGMFYSLAVFAYVPTASPVLSILIAAIAVTFLAVAYAGLIAVMPRAGGDYVWQTRVLDGMPGIVTGAVTGGVALYLVANALGLGRGRVDRGSSSVSSSVGSSAGCAAASASSWLPLAGGSSSRCGRRSTAPSSSSSSSSRYPRCSGSTAGVDFFGSDNGTLVVSLIVIALTSWLVALGMAGYARIQRICLYLGLIGFAVMVVLMLVSSQDQFKPAFDAANQRLFGVAGRLQTRPSPTPRRTTCSRARSARSRWAAT